MYLTEYADSYPEIIQETSIEVIIETCLKAAPLDKPIEEE